LATNHTNKRGETLGQAKGVKARAGEKKKEDEGGTVPGEKMPHT